MMESKTIDDNGELMDLLYSKVAKEYDVTYSREDIIKKFPDAYTKGINEDIIQYIKHTHNGTISLVIGTKNPRKGWIDAALSSAEGLFNETIIIDDGSIEPVMNYIRIVDNLSWMRHTETQGFYMARNTGCIMAKGEWIASLDDDDEFIRENVEKLKEFIKTTDADIVSFSVELFGDQTGYWGNNPNMSNILIANQIPSGSWFKKKVWEKLNGFQIAEGDDWDFWARATKHKFKFAYFPLPVYRHRMHKDAMSAGWLGEKFIQIRDNVRKQYEKERI